jgi:hypothetical protein
MTRDQMPPPGVQYADAQQAVAQHAVALGAAAPVGALGW